MSPAVEKWRQELSAQRQSTAVAEATHQQKLKEKELVQRQLEERAEALKEILPNLARECPWLASVLVECSECVEEVAAFMSQRPVTPVTPVAGEVTLGADNKPGAEDAVGEGEGCEEGGDQKSEQEGDEGLVKVMQELYEESRREARAAAGCIEVMKERQELKRMLDRLELAKQHMFQRIRSRRWEEMLMDMRRQNAAAGFKEIGNKAQALWLDGVAASATMTAGH